MLAAIVLEDFRLQGLRDLFTQLARDTCCQNVALFKRCISYPLAVLKSSKAPERANKFAEYLASPTAQQIFQKFGFIVVK